MDFQCHLKKIYPCECHFKWMLYKFMCLCCVALKIASIRNGNRTVQRQNKICQLFMKNVCQTMATANVAELEKLHVANEAEWAY